MASKSHLLIGLLRQLSNPHTRHPLRAGVFDFYELLVPYIERSAKFFLRADVIQNELIETGTSYMEEDVWQLPFQYTLFEYEFEKRPNGGHEFAFCCTIDDMEKLKVVVDTQPATRPGIYVVHMTLQPDLQVDTIGLAARIEYGSGLQPTVSVAEIAQEHEQSRYDVLDRDRGKRYLQALSGLVIGTVALLDVKGVEADLVVAPEKLNKRRIKRGKTPLYEHRVIKIGGFSKAGHVLGVGINHASPRTHWRRGHVRTLASGKKIPIAAMLINKHGRGFISHEYEVEE